MTVNGIWNKDKYVCILNKKYFSKMDNTLSL